MSLQPRPLEAIPELTRQLAKASFPKGTLAMNLVRLNEMLVRSRSQQPPRRKRARSPLAQLRDLVSA